MAYTAYPFLVLHWQPSIALYQWVFLLLSWLEVFDSSYLSKALLINTYKRAVYDMLLKDGLGVNNDLWSLQTFLLHRSLDGIILRGRLTLHPASSQTRKEGARRSKGRWEWEYEENGVVFKYFTLFSKKSFECDCEKCVDKKPNKSTSTIHSSCDVSMWIESQQPVVFQCFPVSRMTLQSCSQQIM